jgi:hypothetical protein
MGIRKYIIFLLICAVSFAAGCITDTGKKNGIEKQLQVSSNGRYLQFANGTPFFWLGDTGWELFHRLDTADADLYLETLAKQGFNVIQAVVLAELQGLTVPNRYAHLPLVDKNPEKPVEAYFQLVDYMVKKAASLSMVIAMLPTWGDNTTATFFHKEPWLDFNMFQSGHGDRKGPNFIYALTSSQLQPAKPFLDAEPRYEDLPVRFWEVIVDDAYKNNPTEMDSSHTPHGYFNAYDVRRAAYWSVFSGSFGHTYGNGSIFAFWEPGRSHITAVKHNWRKALFSPGAEDMGHLRALIEKYGINILVPDYSMVMFNWGYAENYRLTLITSDRKTALIYIPDGVSTKIHLGKFAGKSFTSQWFDPSDGTYTEKEN